MYYHIVQQSSDIAMKQFIFFPAFCCCEISFAIKVHSTFITFIMYKENEPSTNISVFYFAFLNLSGNIYYLPSPYSESLGWIPMWGEYDDEMVEDFLEAYGLLVEDLEVMYGAYREDNHNCRSQERQLYKVYKVTWWIVITVYG